MPRSVQWLFGTLIAALLFGGPLAYLSYQKAHYRHFRVVRDGVLYRSGQLSVSGLKDALHDHGIRTVITLRDAKVAGVAPPDLKEEEYCQSQDVVHLRLPPLNWWAIDGSVPAEANVRKFLEIMDDPSNYPVLIHCFAGSHRTGAYCAIYRMEYEHWSNEDAMDEMRAAGYLSIAEDWDILDYLERYRPRWKE